MSLYKTCENQFKPKIRYDITSSVIIIKGLITHQSDLQMTLTVIDVNSSNSI